MKTTRTILLTVALCFAATALAFAADNPHMGTWKLNEAKSKFAADSTKNTPLPTPMVRTA